jgi:WD40 repeat protein
MNIRWAPPPNATVLATTATGGLLALWSAQTKDLSGCVRIPGDELYGLDWTCESTAAVVGGRNKVVRAFDPIELQESWCSDLSGHAGRITAVRANPNDTNLVYSAGNDNMLLLWDLRTRSSVGSIVGPRVEGDSLDIERSGRYLLTAGSDREGSHVEIWDVRACARVYWTDKLNGPPNCAGFSRDPQNSYIIVAGQSDARIFNSPIMPRSEEELLSQSTAETELEEPEAMMLDAGPLTLVAGLDNICASFRCLDCSKTTPTIAYGSTDGSVMIVDVDC